MTKGNVAKKAVVIIPTYNERENIKIIVPVLLDVFKTIEDWQMEILVVDDTSPDKTYEAVEKLSKKYKQVHLLVNKRKAGLGAAYLKGMDHAFHKLEADVVFEFDADFSHDPKKIPNFLKKIDEGYDLVLGSRYVPGGSIPQNWGLHRKFLSVFGNLFIMFVMTNFKIKDWTGGYRALTKKTYDAVHPELNSQRFSGYTFQIGFLHTALRKGFKVAEVPFHFIDREIGVSKLGPEYIKNIMLFIVKARLQEIINHRIFKFAFVGGIGALIQLSSLTLLRQLIVYDLAFFLAIEMAVVSNFILNNLWTFSDRRLKFSQIPVKFVQFNLASAGSIIIQQIIGSGGKFFIGLKDLFTLPIIGFTIDTGLVFAVVGILIGMFWNFFAYSTFIWKKKK